MNEINNLLNNYGYKPAVISSYLPPGWMKIFEKLVQELRLNNIEVQFEQIKQKFEEVRIYYTNISKPLEMQIIMKKYYNEFDISCKQCGLHNTECICCQ